MWHGFWSRVLAVCGVWISFFVGCMGGKDGEDARLTFWKVGRWTRFASSSRRMWKRVSESWWFFSFGVLLRLRVIAVLQCRQKDD